MTLCESCATGYRRADCWVCEMLAERERGPCRRGCAAYAVPDSYYCAMCVLAWPWGATPMVQW